LRVALEFVGADLSSKGSAETWNKRIRAFLRPGETVVDRGGILISGLFDVHPPLDGASLASLQREAREFIGSLVRRRDGRAGSSTPLTITTRTTAIDVSDLIPRRKWKGPRHPVLLMIDGDTRDLFLFQLVRLIEQIGTDKVLECPAPDCGQLFVKQTRKEYCSTRCQSRIYMRNLRRELANGKTTRTR
jgi:hypothetical protein